MEALQSVTTVGEEQPKYQQQQQDVTMSGAGEYQPRMIKKWCKLEYFTTSYLHLFISCPIATLDGTNQYEDKRREI